MTYLSEFQNRRSTMIKTILVDDDFLVLQALETILSVQDHIEVVGTGSD